MVGTMRGSDASSQLGLGRTLLYHFPDPARGPESRGADPWPGESYGAGQTRRHHTQNNAHCYRHGGGERYFPIVKGSLGWVERGKSCKVAELRSSVLTSGHRREGPGGGCPYAQEATQHRCSCIRAAQSPSGSPSEGRHHLVSHPQGAMHPGNVKGKEREPRPAAAGTPASGRKALAPALTSEALSGLWGTTSWFSCPMLGICRT